MVVNDICCIRFELDSQSYYRVGIKWDICYKYFLENKDNLLEVSDEACEKLFDYLKAFGMTKRTALFKGKQPSDLRPLVETISRHPKAFTLTLDQYDALSAIYSDINTSLQEIKPGQKSYTLAVTKVMSGVFGCVPAFDRRFIAKFSSIDKRFKGNFSRVDFEILSAFYQDNKLIIDLFSHINLRIIERQQVVPTTIPYPIARLIDCYGWH